MSSRAGNTKIPTNTSSITIINQFVLSTSFKSQPQTILFPDERQHEFQPAEQSKLSTRTWKLQQQQQHQQQQVRSSTLITNLLSNPNKIFIQYHPNQGNSQYLKQYYIQRNKQQVATSIQIYLCHRYNFSLFSFEVSRRYRLYAIQYFRVYSTRDTKNCIIVLKIPS